MATKNDIIEQLVNIYFKEECVLFKDCMKEKMTKEQAIDYHSKMLERKNIVPYIINNKVIGYYERWRLNYEQLGKLLCRKLVAIDEDVSNGNICYFANVWVDKDHRRTKALLDMKIRFFEQNSDCEYFIGEALREKHQPLRVYTKEEIIHSYPRNN